MKYSTFAGLLIFIPMLKMRSILVGLAFLLSSAPSIFAQNYNTKIADPKLNNQKVLVGRCNKAGLTAGTYGVYFESQYDYYHPSGKYVGKLQEKINQVDIKIVFGTWCSDSKVQVPRFYKILDLAGFNEKKLTIIGVNRDKNAVSMNIEDMNVVLVPTFIVYQHGKELGRIIETPKKTLEKDLWKIVSKAQM